MSKLTEQDQANINRISELLAELKPLLYGVSHLIDQDCCNPYAPIAPVEPNTIAQTEQDNGCVTGCGQDACSNGCQHWLLLDLWLE